ncbi:putative SAM-dependent methyltransferase [Hirsutella rhossiliensis]|uniref:SAM-dependent methyltransferase n=1 Tax=Hirsutella rhossiliensis TaxID=111463 RepID=A0A9P8MS31_9HYPO|nr:putative SAM-dependent methyltransferase [Hirsutella rhossiliensis]KAH0960250.1 putative SAM-dependent methyltransferase [Hirsutella rhossiliensis]
MAAQQKQQQRQKEEEEAPEQHPGAAVYTPWVLAFYDMWVLWFSCTYIWKCSTSRVLLPLFRASMGRRHLDIGVGSGYFPARALGDAAAAAPPPCRELTIVDLNPHALEATRRRVEHAAAGAGRRVRVTAVLADVTRAPLPLGAGEPETATAGAGGGGAPQHRQQPQPQAPRFDSASIFFLLHCLPGPPATKLAAVLDAVTPLLGDEATLVGATILGVGRPLGWAARWLLAAYNRRGIFGNAADSEDVLAEGLRRRFRHVDVWCVGAVMLFRARGPKDVEDGGGREGGRAVAAA